MPAHARRTRGRSTATTCASPRCTQMISPAALAPARHGHCAEAQDDDASALRDLTDKDAYERTAAGDSPTMDVNWVTLANDQRYPRSRSRRSSLPGATARASSITPTCRAATARSRWASFRSGPRAPSAARSDTRREVHPSARRRDLARPVDAVRVGTPPRPPISATRACSPSAATATTSSRASTRASWAPCSATSRRARFRRPARSADAPRPSTSHRAHETPAPNTTRSRGTSGWRSRSTP